MCQKKSEGGIRCVRDSQVALDKARASGNKKKITIREVQLEEANYYSDTQISDQLTQGLHLISKGDSRGRAMVNEAETRRKARRARQARNIAAYYIKRIASFIPEFINKMRVKWSKDYAKKAKTANAAQLRRDAKHEDSNVRAAVASNPNTTPKTLGMLASDPDHVVRAAVALNVRTPAESLTLLAEENDPQINESLAYNRSTPVEILTSYANAEDVPLLIRIALATNPRTPPEILESYFIRKKGMMNDHLNVDQVNERLASNPSTPVHILSILRTSKKREIKNAARFTLGEFQLVR